MNYFRRLGKTIQPSKSVRPIRPVLTVVACVCDAQIPPAIKPAMSASQFGQTESRFAYLTLIFYFILQSYLYILYWSIVNMSSYLTNEQCDKLQVCRNLNGPAYVRVWSLSPPF